MRLWNVLGAMAMLLVFSAGCSRFKEVYHFRATAGEHTNYYRVTVKGWTVLSASQYAAGNYDAQAVDALFGELQGAKVRVDSTSLQGHPARVVQQTSVTTAGGTTTTTSTTAAAAPSAAVPGSNAADESTKTKLETLTGENLDQKKFVFFLSSNSDFFVNQISTYVTTREMQQSIVTLILKEDIAALEKQRLSGRTGDEAAETLATRLRAISKELRTPADGTVTNADATSAVTAVLKTLAQNSTVSAGVNDITSVATAKQWLQDHPRAFVEGVNR